MVTRGGAGGEGVKVGGLHGSRQGRRRLSKWGEAGQKEAEWEEMGWKKAGRVEAGLEVAGR